MKKIDNYQVLYGDDVLHLTNLVREAFLTGWQPLGAPFAGPLNGNGNHMVYQGLVKYERDMDDEFASSEPK